MLVPKKIERVVIFGGGGLVGYQICRLLAREVKPSILVVCALKAEEAQYTVSRLKDEFGENETEFIAEYGNIFVRDEYAHHSRREIQADNNTLSTIYNDVYGDLRDEQDNIGNKGLLPQIIMKYKPAVFIRVHRRLVFFE